MSKARTAAKKMGASTRADRGARLLAAARGEATAADRQPVPPDTPIQTALLKGFVGDNGFVGLPGGEAALKEVAAAQPADAWKNFDAEVEVNRHDADGTFTGHLSVRLRVRDKATGRYLIFNPHDVMMTTDRSRVVLGAMANLVPDSPPAIHSVS